MASAKNRDLLIDILRCGAVLYIVGFWHLSEYSNALSSPCKTKTAQFLAFSALGVLVYLSGFLLSQKYRFENLGDVLRFYQRRFWRIYPPYFIALTLFLIMGYINPRDYIEASLLSNMFTGKSLMTLWFVTMIFVFYIITPVFLLFYKPARIIVCTLAAYFGLLGFHVSCGYIHPRLVQYLPVFAAGILIARSLLAQRAIQNRIIVLISFLCFMFFLWIFTTLKNELFLILVISLGSLAGIPVFLTLAKNLSPFLNRKLIILISHSSFCLYLLHRITFGAGTLLYRPQTVISAILYLAGVLLPITLIIAYAFQTLYDRWCAPRRTLPLTYE